MGRAASWLALLCEVDKTNPRLVYAAREPMALLKKGYYAAMLSAIGCFYLACQWLLDVEGTKDKLGVLWTWDTSERGGAFKVLPGSRVLQSVPMMPRFKKDTAEYSMDIGMHENPFTLDSRARPPYTKCKCGAAD